MMIFSRLSHSVPRATTTAAARFHSLRALSGFPNSIAGGTSNNTNSFLPGLGIGRPRISRCSFSTCGVRMAGPGARHGDAGWKRWRGVFALLCFPAIALANANVFLVTSEKGTMVKDKEKHWDEENERPKFVPYSYLRLHSKAFPWGDGNHTLFHNADRNCLREGFEEGKHGWYWGEEEMKEEAEAVAERDSDKESTVSPSATGGEPFDATKGMNPTLKFGGAPPYPPVPGKPFAAQRINEALKRDRAEKEARGEKED